MEHLGREFLRVESMERADPVGRPAGRMVDRDDSQHVSAVRTPATDPFSRVRQSGLLRPGERGRARKPAERPAAERRFLSDERTGLRPYWTSSDPVFSHFFPTNRKERFASTFGTLGPAFPIALFQSHYRRLQRGATCRSAPPPKEPIQPSKRP